MLELEHIETHKKLERKVRKLKHVGPDTVHLPAGTAKERRLYAMRLLQVVYAEWLDSPDPTFLPGVGKYELMGLMRRFAAQHGAIEVEAV